MAHVSYLHDCVLNRNMSLLVSLLDHGADVNSRNKQEQTLLHIAARLNYKEAIELLLNRGAKVNLQDHNGWTPLHAGAEHAEVVKELLNKGASPNCKGFDCLTPLHLAAMYNNVEGVKLLINKGADINVQERFNNTTLHLAVQNNYEAMATLLLDSGVDVSIKNDIGDTALHCAAHLDNCYVSRLIIERGADVNVKNSFGRTPLFVAVTFGCIENVQLLLRSGAIVNTFDRCGKTPLHDLIFFDSEQMILLIINGAEVNAKDENGNTPLHLAVDNVHVKAVATLLDCGASKDITNCHGQTPLALINDIAIVEIFDKHLVKLECIRMISNQVINYESLECFQKACVKELTIMKEIKFGYHSVFSVLSKYDDPTFVKSSLLEQEIFHFEDRFPIYHLILLSTFLRAKKRYNMLYEVQGYFRVDILPEDVKRKILTYLNDDDLLNIIKVLKNE